MTPELDLAVKRQSGVVTRRQLIATGSTSHELRTLLRRRDLVRMGPGVYLTHTGEPTWEQRAWAGVLLHEPAALSHGSALRAAGFPGRWSAEVEVAVDRNRGLAARPGVRLHRTSNFEGRVRWTTDPPRIRVEEALVDVVSGVSDELAAIAVMADAIQSRKVSARRVRLAIEGRRRVARREMLTAVLRDVEDGTGSVLEHGYLVKVERPHGLPRGIRQARSGVLFRDVLYAEFGQVVELDGRVFHDGAERRDHDLGRDLAAAVSGLATVRLGWGQVFARPCETAVQVGALLSLRGWPGRVAPCADCR